MEYLRSIFLRYKKAACKQKTTILNEFCANCGYQRKQAIRVIRTFKRFTKPKPKKRGRPSGYNNLALIKPLKPIWLVVHLPCSNRLKTVLPLWLPYYEQEFEPLAQHTLDLLLRISASSINSTLKPIQINYKCDVLSFFITKRGYIQHLDT